MMTLNLGHDVSERVFVYFSLVSSKKKVSKKILNYPPKKHVRVPHTPACLGAVVLAHPGRAVRQCDIDAAQPLEAVPG